MKAVALLSGGLDSAVVLAHAQSLGYETYALTVNYGQRHAVEIRAALQVASYLGVKEHAVMNIPGLGLVFAGSSLTSDSPVTKTGVTDSPTSYVPARNLLLLSLATAWAETLGAQDIFIGANAQDFAGYPDCRPAFLTAFQTAARLGTRAGSVTVHAPLMGNTKADTIRRGMALGVPLHITSSCYDPADEGPCCECDACRLRAEGFEAAMEGA